MIIAITIFFAVASAVLLYLHLTRKAPSCPKAPECPKAPTCPEQAPCPTCPAQPPCPSFMGFEMRGDYQEILTIIDNLKSLGSAVQTGMCENIDGAMLASILDEARRANERMDQPEQGYPRSCSQPYQELQRNIIATIMNNTNFNNTNKGKIAVEIIKLISHMPEVLCDSTTDRIDLVKLENTFRAIHRAFCGGDLV